jgi:hypothetical protein
VSRQHVALVEDGTRWLLEDLSGHGTQVGGKPLKHGELNDGASLELGPWVAVFRQHSSSGAAAAPTQPGRTDVHPRELAYLTAPGGVRAILEHLGLPTLPGRLAPARGPPQTRGVESAAAVARRLPPPDGKAA